MKRTIAEIVVFMALAWAALNLSLFGAGDRADKYVQDVVNTHFSGLLYPYPPHPDITVLLLTDHALNTDLQQGRWPARYDFHGRVLKAVLTQQPKAVFIDFLWLSQRPQNPDGSYQDGALLLRQLNAYQQANIPVYLAATPAVMDNWKELEGLVKWVSVPLNFDISDFVARQYPPEAAGLETAAFRIAQELYEDQFPKKPSVPMDIVWSPQVNEGNHAWMNPDTKPRETSLPDVLLKGHTGIAMDTPFNTTLFVRDLLNPIGESPEQVYEELQNLLHDKIVLYGANLQGVNDLVFTPARSIQPGVYFHAMALDNLLRWGPKYKSDVDTGSDRWLTHSWISMLAVLPIVVTSVLIGQVARGIIVLPQSLARIAKYIEWGKEHPFLRFLVITSCLLLWFGTVALIEFRYLHYSASVVVGYLQVIIAGFFIERSALVERLVSFPTDVWRWLNSKGPAPN